ncbi:MAG TPA: sulfotransferase family 2 domain-containing protein [Stellaceae bacterium]|nr:sulfotransferase family 2 domain-containing protein [Stellaceae bacterium]
MTYADFRALLEGRLGYAVASFVRNPYDRVYSGFIQVQRDQRNQPGEIYPAPWIGDLVLRQLAENAAQLDAAGGDFDRWLALVEEWQVYEAGRNSSFPLHPAHYWTHEDGRQAVDFIGRAESFEADFARLCRTFDLDNAGTANANVRVDPSQTGRFGYKYAHLMSAASIDRIERLFDTDFSLFRYERLSRR